MTPQQLADTLQQIHHDCPSVTGTVLATADGLLLSATGVLDTEAAAAMAVHLAEDTGRHLALLRKSACAELMVWGEDALWFIQQLPNGMVLMACAAPGCASGLLRLVVRTVGGNLPETL